MFLITRFSRAAMLAVTAASLATLLAACGGGGDGGGTSSAAAGQSCSTSTHTVCTPRTVYTSCAPIGCVTLPGGAQSCTPKVCPILQTVVDCSSQPVLTCTPSSTGTSPAATPPAAAKLVSVDVFDAVDAASAVDVRSGTLTSSTGAVVDEGLARQVSAAAKTGLVADDNARLLVRVQADKSAQIEVRLSGGTSATVVPLSGGTRATVAAQATTALGASGSAA